VKFLTFWLVVIAGAFAAGTLVMLPVASVHDAVQHGFVTALWAAIPFVGFLITRLLSLGDYGSEDERWNRAFITYFKFGHTYTEAAKMATMAPGVGPMVAFVCLLVGIYGVIDRVARPLITIADGADVTVCCSPTYEAVRHTLATSPDSRWLILAGRHQQTFGKDSVALLVIDLDSHKPVVWDTALWSGTATYEHVLSKPESSAGALEDIHLIGTAEGITVSIGTPPNEYVTTFSVPIPAAHAAAWTRSWSATEPKATAIAHQKNRVEFHCGRSSWASTDLRSTMHWSAALPDEQRHWYDLIPEARQISISDAATGRVLKSVTIRDLPGSFLKCVDAPESELRDQLETISRYRVDISGDEEIPFSNADGTSWILLSAEFLKFVTLPPTALGQSLNVDSPAVVPHPPASRAPPLPQTASRLPEPAVSAANAPEIISVPSVASPAESNSGPPATGFAEHDLASASIDGLSVAALAGNDAANTELGVRYLNGNGVEKSYKAAIDHFEMPAKHGDPRALTNLGWMATLGQGVERNDADALGLFQAAAEKGYPNAEDSLGYMYEHGRGVPIDLDIAATWYRKAAKQGFAKSKANLQRLSQQ
jgi:hypothetical protein